MLKNKFKFIDKVLSTEQKKLILDLYDKYQTVILPVGSIAIGLLLLVLVVFPQVKDILGKNNELAKVNQDLTKLQSKVEQLNSVNVESYKENLELSFIALPVDKDIPQAYNQITFLTSTNRLDQSSISFSNANSDPGKLSNFSVKLELLGTLDDLKKFITVLESAPRIMQIKELEYTSGISNQRARINLSLDIFFAKLPDVTATLEQDLPVISGKETELLTRIKDGADGILPGSSGDAPVPEGKENPFE